MNNFRYKKGDIILFVSYDYKGALMKITDTDDSFMGSYQYKALIEHGYFSKGYTYQNTHQFIEKHSIKVNTLGRLLYE